jgi:hypothetical protein
MSKVGKFINRVNTGVNQNTAAKRKERAELKKLAVDAGMTYATRGTNKIGSGAAPKAAPTPKKAKGGETKKDDKFIQKAVKEMDKKGTKGAFTKKANRRDMSVKQFTNEVLDNPSKYDLKTRRQAQFVKNITNYGHGGDVEFAKGGKMKKFKAGDMWSNDFDYDGMLEYGRNINTNTDDIELQKYRDSLEDVNYHTLAAELYNLSTLQDYDDKKINYREAKRRYLRNFKRKLNDEFASQGLPTMSTDEYLFFKQEGGEVEFGHGGDVEFAKGGEIKEFRVRTFDMSGRDEDMFYFDDEEKAYDKFIDVRSTGQEVAIEELVSKDEGYETSEYYDPMEDMEDEDFEKGGTVLTKEYKDYLDNLRDSGETNMFGAGRYLEAEFGLDKREAREVLSKWMKSFAKGGVIPFSSSNLYFNGFGKDSSGNSVIKVSFPNSRAFSIQTNGDLPKTHSLKQQYSKIENLSEKDLKVVEKEVNDYVKEFGSDSQIKKLNTYSKGGTMKKQGYNDKLDESLSMRKGKASTKKQSDKDRRDESKGMEKSMGKRAYASVGTMDKMAKGGTVEFETRKKMKLTPIGDIAFVFDSKSKRKGKRILVREVDIIQNKRHRISEADSKRLLKEMRKKGSDLLTDGTRFYTTFGTEIGEIKHPQFKQELELDRELYGIDFEKGGITIYAKGGTMKKQGYNDKLDESLGNRKGKESTKKQSLKDRRDESKGEEKALGKRAYSSVSTMDKLLPFLSWHK